MPLPLDQMEIAKDLYYQIYQKNTTDPCLDKNMFTCKLINDGINKGIYTITQLGLKKNNDTQPIIRNANFSVFKNATYIMIGDGILLDSSLFNTLPNFYNKASIYIYNESIQIPNNIILPNNLNQITFTFISVPIPSNLFSGSIEVFNILGVGNGFSLPSLLPQNTALKRFSTFLGYYSPFPSNAGSALKNLTSLRLSFNNDITEISYRNYSFPTFEPFNKLQTLYITFVNFGNDSNSQLWNFEQSITTLSTLNDLHITGKGFILDSSFKFTDFSNLPETFFIYFSNGCDLISNCNSKPCLKLPQKSGISVIDCNFNITNIDFTNVTYMKMQNNYFEQELPNNNRTNSNIDYSLTRFDFQDNLLIGSIPEEYCQFYKSKYPTLSYNELTGDVPTCFSCMGANYTITKNLLPNQFTDFNEKSLPTNCETFNFSTDYNKIVKTDGSTIITIKGKDFGWDFSLPSTSTNNATLLITIPNNEITLSIPKGEGSNKTFVANFGYQFKFSQTFTYSYEFPVIYSYSFRNNNNNNNSTTFYLNGNGFSFINNNTITLNGVPYQLSIADTNNNDSNGDTSISFIDGEINPIDSMQIGQEFNVSINVGNQVSNTVTFYLYKSISISVSSLSDIKLNISGSSNSNGDVTFDGEFGTTNSKIVFVKINGIQCIVKSVTPQSLTISSYPPVPSVGKYQISINVGGLIFTDQIEYIENPTTPSSENSDDGDDGSSAPLLSQPISLLSSIILSMISLTILSQ
ncbi:hypothetical protein ACTFIU_006163 [Dictyostelium citrinum]